MNSAIEEKGKEKWLLVRALVLIATNAGRKVYANLRVKVKRISVLRDFRDFAGDSLFGLPKG
jgi:hypothetical protein